MKFLSTLAAFLFAITTFAQEKLEVQGKLPDLYVQRTVGTNESLQTLGSRFGVLPGKLAAYNSLDPAAPLTKSSKIRIPLTRDNFVQVKTDNGTPVYHVVDKGDNLYRISINYNKIGTATLKEWNNMTTDVVKNGQSIIVGFITGKPVPAEKKDKSKADSVAQSVAVTTPPAEKKKIPKVVTKKDSTVVAPPITETTPVVEQPKKETASQANYSPKDGDEGYFATTYATQNSNQLKQFRSGDAAVFKTVSGWTDRKYYILMNDAAVGTIVRITGAGNKNICAKVLGPLQETKNGNSLLLRMSNAAAAALGITDAKFAVTVTYFE